MYQSFQRAFKAHGKKKRFKETSSSLAGKYRHPGQLQYNTWLKILQDDAFCTQPKKA